MTLSTARPVLFLDVDGVLNCIAWNGSDYDNLKQRIGGWTCVVPPGTKERVQALLEHYDPVWATAWLGRAHSAWRDVLGLDPIPWPYVSYSDLKLPEIIRAARGRRWAWVDDDALWELDRLGWTDNHADGLIVAPDGRYGLTDEIVERLVEYATQEVDVDG